VLTGTADLAALLQDAPEMTTLNPDPLVLEDALIFQAAFELPANARTALLPPGLHPTNPPLLILLAWKVARSPWGAFALAQARVSCRSGVRPRGFVIGCVTDNAAAAAVLAAQWGLAARLGEVELRHRYDATELAVSCGGGFGCRVVGINPAPLTPADVAFTVTMTLAHTDRGPRLVQLEPEYSLHDVERLRPRLERLERLPIEPGAQLHPVAATLCDGSVTIPRLRFVCRPDVLAFEGTETVAYP
jgi:hypothetical protein